MQCSVEACGARAVCKGMCDKHYQRVRRNGHLRLKQPAVPAWMQAHLSHQGEDCLIWPFARLNNGYGAVRHRSSVHPASRVMCEMAHGAPPSSSSEAAHSCGNGHLGCVHPAHLFWKSKPENEADKVEHGTSNRGERCGSAKLTEEQVLQIRSLDGKFTRGEIGEMFGVSRQTAKDIILRRRWAWLA